MPDKLLIWLSLASLYLIPPLGGADFALRPIYGFYLCLPFFYAKQQAVNFLAYYLLFMISVLFSIVYGWAFLRVEVVLSDVIELFKLMLPWLAFLFGYLLFDKYNKKYVEKLAYLAIIFVSIVCLQFSKIYNGLFSRVYAADSQLPAALGVDTDYMRIVGVSGNPNDAGMLFFFLQLFFLFSYLKNKSGVVAFSWFGSVLSLILTQSKTAYAALVFSLIVSSIINGKNRIMLGGGALAVLAYLLYSNEIVYVHNFLTAVQDEGLFSANVFAIRFENASTALSLWQESKLLGWGVAKSIHPSVVDVEYFLLLRRYGMIGVLFLMVFMASMVWQSLPGLKSDDDSVNISASFIFVGTFSILIFMLSNNFFSAYYNQYFYFMMLGVFACAARSVERTGRAN